MTPGIGLLVVFALLVFVGGGLVYLSLVGALRGGDMQERMKVFAEIPDLQPRRGTVRRNTQLARLRLRLNAVLAGLGSEELNRQLMSANWPLTVGEYLLIRLGAGLLGLALGWLLFGSPISGVGLAVIAYLAPAVLLRRGVHRRRTQFERQLVDVLVLINGAVRAGFSLLQAMEVVEREMAAPASEEFRRVQREVGLGLPLSGALTNLAARMQNQDLDLMVTAINIQGKVGGNLTTMLTAVTETIRDRVRLFAEVRVLTTQQRYTSYLLSLLPILLAAIMFFINPEYMGRLFEPGPYICIPIGGLLGIIAGYFAIQRLGRIEV